MKESLRLIYMAGGASYTLIPLKRILESKHKLIQVYTKHPKPSGRGNKISANALQKFLDEKKIPFSFPKNLRLEEEVKKIKDLNPDIILVFSYGNILPKSILDIPKWGCINIHASLLPSWRGASPIQATIMNGDKETGITLMKMTKGLDCGPIYSQYKMKLTQTESGDVLMKMLPEKEERRLPGQLRPLRRP